MREGTTGAFGSLGSTTVKSISALKARVTTLGQGRGAVAPDENEASASVWLLVNTAGNGQAIARVDAEGGVEWPYTTADLPPGHSGSAVFKSFAVPTQDEFGAVAFRARTKRGDVTPENDHALFAEDSDRSVLARLVTKGDAAAGLPEGAVFASFKDPASAGYQRLAFVATATGGGLTNANNQGLWYRDEAGELSLVAQKGRQAPDAPDGAVFEVFSSVALPANSVGPIFTARLKADGTTITKANDIGLWATTSEGEVVCILREGDSIGGKTVERFNVLKAVVGSPAQTRAFNSAGGLIVQVKYKDNTMSIVRLNIP